MKEGESMRDRTLLLQSKMPLNINLFSSRSRRSPLLNNLILRCGNFVIQPMDRVSKFANMDKTNPFYGMYKKELAQQKIVGGIYFCDFKHYGYKGTEIPEFLANTLSSTKKRNRSFIRSRNYRGRFIVRNITNVYSKSRFVYPITETRERESK